MRLNNYLKSRINLVGALGLLIGLTSCGSYQYAGYENDGIYGSSERTVEYVEVAPAQDTQNNNSEYYQNYFREKALELDNIDTDELIFTDIDSYEGAYEVENDTLDYEGYGGWGQNSNDVTINIYNNRPFYSNYWYPWSWRNRFYPYYGWHNNIAFGYYYDYWYSPFYIGWNRPYWYNHYYPYYGYSNFYYGHNYYNRRSVAYNAGRRGSLYSNSNVSGITNRRNVVGRSATSGISRRSSISSTTNRSNIRTTSETVQRRRVVRAGDNVRPRTTTTRPRTTTTRPRTTRSNNTFTRPTRSSTRSSTTRTRTNNNYNRSSSSSRSNNNYRSSSSSNRSSGVSRSSSSSSSRSNSSGSRSSSRRNNL